MIKYYYECECESDEHRLVFTYDSDKDFKSTTLYCSVFLNSEAAWYQRLWMAIKYVFGYKCKYGHFGCWLIKPKDAGRMITMLERYISTTKEG